MRSNGFGNVGAIALMVMLTACSGDGDGGDSDQKRVAAAAEAAVAQGLVGAVFGKTSTEALVAAAAGQTRQDQGQAVTIEHRFAIGSNGKSITAMLAADLVERGELSWSSTVAEVLPEVAGDMNPAYRQVTLLDLLDHRSGLLPLTDDSEFSGYDGDLPDDPWLLRLEVVDWILRQPPVAAPGSAFVYSNAGYTVAGAMLEKVAGDSYVNLVNQRVLVPLGLIAVQTIPALDDETQPFGHSGERLQLTERDPSDPIDLLILEAIAPAGSLAMTAMDYGRYLQWHTLALSGQATPLPASYVERLSALAADDYSLGWQASAGVGGTLLFHIGENVGFTTLAVLDQKGGSALWALTNSAANTSSDDWVVRLLLELAALL